MKPSLFFLVLIFLTISSKGVNTKKQFFQYNYTSAVIPWNEAYGNHRAVLNILKPSDVVSLYFKWRRPDKDIANRRMLIVNALTGDTIQNIQRIDINNEFCKIKFGPVKLKGKYFFYYLPYEPQLGGGSFTNDYLKPEKSPDHKWLAKCSASKTKSEAQIIKVESRTAFDSFYPMEVCATEKEQQEYRNKFPQKFYLFPENRKHPIRMRHKIPSKWLAIKPGEKVYATAFPNEYYTMQIGLWAPNYSLNQIRYKASSFKSGKFILPSSIITCFNTEGINPNGRYFKKQITVKQGMVQPLWFGFDIPKNVKKGIYKGVITIYDKKISLSVPIEINIAGLPVADRGDSELWKHSRLRWLNSTLGISDAPIKPYTNITVDENEIDCLGRKVIIDKTTGLPEQINSWGNNILATPIQFVIETTQGIKHLRATPQLKEATSGHATEEWQAEDNDIIIFCKATMEFDGWMNYIYTITPKKTLNIKDIRLEINLQKNIATCFQGIGLPGQDTPTHYEGKWDAPEKNINDFGVSIPTNKKQHWLWPFDSFWVGNAFAGIHCELRGTTYSGPLLNAYRPPYPSSWNNNGKGGFTITRNQHSTQIISYSGERLLKSNQSIIFDFALIITPVKPLNTESQFKNRYYHCANKPEPTDKDINDGVRIINIHHANDLNPFINYPFLTVDKLKNFTAKWHQKGCKTKIYYTLRELTSATTELWAFRSLGYEIIKGGEGGGYPWCREHLIEDYTPQWYQHFEHIDQTGIAADAALLTSESQSRLYNYYIEGLHWSVKNLDIDGLYLDDVSYNRDILKRMKRAMNAFKKETIIDLHSNTGFSKGPANQYMEFFPYIDKLWFGESFLYNQMTPTNWLVESSGIPFGLMGDMLYRGGNKWLGMQYGMSVRYPWATEEVTCDPRIVWKIWDDFNIKEAKMHGFWESEPIVTTTDDAVKVTTYIKKDEILLSIGNYSDESKNIRLNINFGKINLTLPNVELFAPEIDGFQKEQHYNLTETMTVDPRKGLLIYLKKK